MSRRNSYKNGRAYKQQSFIENLILKDLERQAKEGSTIRLSFKQEHKKHITASGK